MTRSNREFLKEALLKGIARHGSQALGGALAVRGIGTQNDAEVVVGLALSAIAYGWSAFRKWRRSR